MRILLVEDEAPLRETLAARLKREGFAVDAAQDGEEGLYMGREVPFDVGIIDLGLPKMSGMELIKALRDEGKKFPVLILTARSSWQDKVEGLKQGADDYLVKPFHVEELLARVNALLRRAAGWSKPTLECGPVALDLAAQTVSVSVPDGGDLILVSAFAGSYNCFPTAPNQSTGLSGRALASNSLGNGISWPTINGGIDLSIGFSVKSTAVYRAPVPQGYTQADITSIQVLARLNLMGPSLR